jgi:hypothetical protein
MLLEVCSVPMIGIDDRSILRLDLAILEQETPGIIALVDQLYLVLGRHSLIKRRVMIAQGCWLISEKTHPIPNVQTVEQRIQNGALSTWEFYYVLVSVT